MKSGNSPWKTIGILGGMGPEAAAELYKRIIRICQLRYGAIRDYDFPPMLVYNLPLPDILGNNTDRKLIKELIVDSFRKLEAASRDEDPCQISLRHNERIQRDHAFGHAGGHRLLP